MSNPTFECTQISVKTLPSTLKLPLRPFLDLISLPFGHSQFSSIFLLSFLLYPLLSAILYLSSPVPPFLACLLVYVCVFWPSAHIFSERPSVSPALPIIWGWCPPYIWSKWPSHLLSVIHENVLLCLQFLFYKFCQLFCSHVYFFFSLLCDLIFPPFSSIMQFPSCLFFKPIFLHFSPLPCTAMPMFLFPPFPVLSSALQCPLWGQVSFFPNDILVAVPSF